MPKNDADRVRHMLRAAREAVELVRGKSQQDLEQGRLLQLAILRLLEVVGEAARQVSPDVQRLHAQIEWPKIVGMRNHLIHGYADVDLDIVWQVLTVDLPRIIPQLERILSSEKPG
jgi:uncharacterized protein with HEPN domain